MATVISVMDRDAWDARTDIIVVVDPRKWRLVWIPRDVWCEKLGDRINRAFSIGGHQALIDGLAQLGFRVDHSLCLRRQATERALADVTVSVRVKKPQQFWYPLSPTEAIEDGRKPVDFVPPFEALSGERLHQWIGARYRRDASDSTDFERIRRQQILLRALLKIGFAFDLVLKDPSLVAMSSERALADLRRVRRWWRFGRLRRLSDREIDGMQVLVRGHYLSLRVLPRRH